MHAAYLNLTDTATTQPAAKWIGRGMVSAAGSGNDFALARRRMR